MNLRFQFRDLSLVRASYDFTPDQTESNMLLFRSGEVSLFVALKLSSLGPGPGQFQQSESQ